MLTCEVSGGVGMTVIFFMESGLGKVTLENGPFIGVLPVTDSLVPKPGVAGGSRT